MGGSTFAAITGIPATGVIKAGGMSWKKAKRSIRVTRQKLKIGIKNVSLKAKWLKRQNDSKFCIRYFLVKQSYQIIQYENGQNFSIKPIMNFVDLEMILGAKIEKSYHVLLVIE